MNIKHALLVTATVLLTSCGGNASAVYHAGRSAHFDPHHARSHPAFLARLWSRVIAPNADSAPVYSARVRLRTGKTRPVVYVLAGNNGADWSPGAPVRRATLYALDAASGRIIWTRSTTGPSRCTTSGPAVDPSGHWVYASGLDGKVHRYAAGSGQEMVTDGWPRRITLTPSEEKTSAAITITWRYLYVTTSGFIGDQGHYEGHLVAINTQTSRSHVFNTLCSNVRHLLSSISGQSDYCPYVQSGLFGRGQGMIDPANGDVWIVSGNGPWNGRTNWGDSVLKVDPSGTRLLDSYTPTDQAYLDQNDLDLGSSEPARLPSIRQGRHIYHLLVQAGKGPVCPTCSGAAIRLLNRSNLSGRSGAGHLGGDLQDISAPGGCEVLTAPAVWRSPSGSIWIFYANDCGLVGYRLFSPRPGDFRLQAAWQIKQGGTTPVVSGGKLYVARSGSVVAYRLRNHSVAGSAAIGALHWQYPLVAGGRMFITDQGGRIEAFGTR